MNNESFKIKKKRSYKISLPLFYRSIILFSIFTFYSCLDDCENVKHQAFTEDEFKFIPYRYNDSISFKNKEKNEFFLKVNYADICHPCSSWYEDPNCRDGGLFVIRDYISIDLISDIPFIDTNLLEIGVYLFIKKDKEPKFGYFFSPNIKLNLSADREYMGILILQKDFNLDATNNSLEFIENTDRVSPDPEIVYFDEYRLNGKLFSKTHMIIDTSMYSYFDTIVYNPEVGFLKFANDSVSYHFVKKHK